MRQLRIGTDEPFPDPLGSRRCTANLNSRQAGSCRGRILVSSRNPGAQASRRKPHQANNFPLFLVRFGLAGAAAAYLLQVGCPVCANHRCSPLLGPQSTTDGSPPGFRTRWTFRARVARSTRSWSPWTPRSTRPSASAPPIALGLNGMSLAVLRVETPYLFRPRRSASQY